MTGENGVLQSGMTGASKFEEVAADNSILVFAHHLHSLMLVPGAGPALSTWCQKYPPRMRQSVVRAVLAESHA